MMTNNNFKQSLFLTRFYLRRDWLKIVLWLVCLAGLMVAAAAKFNGLYSTDAAISSIATTLKTPAMVSLFGVFTASEPYSPAVIYAMEMAVFMGLFIAMMNIYFAVKNTRAEEDSGISELMFSHAVGRFAQLTAVIIELVVINLIFGIVASLGLQVSGMNGINLNGSLLFGFGLAFFGLMFAAISLLMAQLSDNARGATVLSYAVMGIMYIVRMMTDVQNPDYTWWTPFGWIEKLSVYVDNNWWPVIAMLGFGATVIGVTFVANAHRDLAAGMLATRAGRKRASRFLQGPFTLLLRLERTPIIVWAVGLFVLGASYGSIFGTVGDIMKTNPMLGSMIGTTGVHAANRTIILEFASMLSVIFVILATVPSMQIILRINSDDKKGWMEQIHSKSVSRLHLYASYLGLAVIVGVISLLLMILGMAMAGNIGVDSPVSLDRFMRAFYGYLPPLLLVLGIGTLFSGLLPRLQVIVWIVPVYGFFSLYLGKLIDLPKWAQRLTPYGWINKIPLHQVDVSLSLWLVCAAVFLFVVGYLAYQRRDLLTN